MRKQPYTETGIKKCKCFRCGKPAYSQWQICSLDNKYFPICRECDIKLNKLVLKFMKFTFWKGIIEKYKNITL